MDDEVDDEVDDDEEDEDEEPELVELVLELPDVLVEELAPDVEAGVFESEAPLAEPRESVR